MKNLYETVDKLECFTSLKEKNIEKHEEQIITRIELCFYDYKIALAEPVIIGFNKFDNKGYLVADLKDFVLEEEYLIEFLISNKIEKVIVYFSDDTQRNYYIAWTSAFDNIYGNVYIILFEVRNGECYQEF